MSTVILEHEVHHGVYHHIPCMVTQLGSGYLLLHLKNDSRLDNATNRHLSLTMLMDDREIKING